MRSRYLPYATTPARLTAQLFSDIAIAIWITLWVLVGAAVHSAISTIGEFGRDLESGANGVADNLGGARRGRTTSRSSETRSAIR